jgi:RHS repeat-associated protein
MNGYGSGGAITFSGGGRSFFNGRDFSFNNPKSATADKNKNKVKCQGYAADPVEVDDGAKILSIPLFSLPGEMGLKYTLYYQSVTGSSIWDYNPWRSSIDYDLDLYCGVTNPNIACSEVTYYRPDGSSISFSGNHASYGNFPEIGGGGLATLVHNTNGTWTLHDEDSNTLTFDTNGYFTSIKDVSGVGWTISSSATTNGVPLTAPPVHPCDVPGLHPMCVDPNPPPPSDNTTKTTTVVTHTDGQSYTIVSTITNNTTYMTGSVTVTDPAGNQYSYVLSWYQAPGGGGLWSYDLSSLTFPGTPATTMSFSYTGADQLLSGVAYNGAAYWATNYNSDNEVSSDGAADGTERTSIVYATSTGGMVATITNPLGLTTKNTYTTDAQGNYLLASVSNSAVQGCGATTNSLAWDGNDNLKSTVDNDGVTHTYSYAANGQLQTETEAAGTAVARKADYVWDPDAQLNRLSSVTVEGETKTSYTYNAQNRIASVTRTNLTGIGTANQALTTSYAYTLYGNGMVETLTVTQPSPSGSDHTTYAYDSHGNLSSVTDGLGHATTYSGYNALGEVGKIVGPNGDETDYTYDARGRVASKTTHPNGTTATWTYGYDGFGLLATVTAPDGEVTTWTRDAEQRVKTITHNDKDGTSTETFAYDADNDITSDVIARGSDVGKSTSYVYNALGKVYQVKGSHGQVLTYGYDGNGNVLSVTDALGHKTSYAYDALNRRIGATNAAGGITSYTYDAGDHVTGVEDPRGLVTSYEWDGLGLLWQKKSPDTGTTNYTFDGDGRLQSFVRADGTRTNYAYDALNRVTSIGAGSETRTYTWDTCTNGKGRLCAASLAGSNSVGYSYSPEGWITGRSFGINGGPSYGLGYAYDNMGHLSVVDYPDGNQALYYYTDGAVSQVNLQVGTYLVGGVDDLTYRPMDLAMSGWTSYNGLTNTIAYDSDLRPTSITVPGVESLTFNYDTANRITGITNGMDGSQSETLGYDALNRLNSAVSTADSESYQYDADGNRTSQVINGVASSFAYPSISNRLTSVSGGLNGTFGYNANGDTVTVDGLAAYTYDSFERLVNTAGTTFTISAEGQRLEKTSAADGTTYFATDANGPLLAEDQNGTWMDYVWLNGRMVTVVANGGVYPVAGDQTGRPLALTHPATQAILWETEGLPFDRGATTNHWGGFNIGFPGQYYDEEDGLWYNGNRDYDASLGRYVESDPIGLAGGINTYAYAGDNPISNVDPLGLCDKPKCTAWQQSLAALAGGADQLAGATSTGAAELGLGAFGIEVSGLGPEDPFADAAAGVAADSAALAETASVGLSVTAGALRTEASGGNFNYLGRAIAVSTLGKIGSLLMKVPGLGETVGYGIEKAVDDVAPPLPPPCTGSP